MKEALRKILAGWHGVFIDASYWLYVVRLEDEHQDFWTFLGEWLEERPSSPAPWENYLKFGDAPWQMAEEAEP